MTMSHFQYRALQSDGALVEGRIEAGGRQEAFRQLEGIGLNPVKLSEARETRRETERPKRFALRRRKVPFRALENFTRQLSSLLTAGVPLSRSLSILHREASSPVAGEEWKKLHDLVIDGTSLADAMGRFPGTFSRVYRAMVRAGEMGGFLDVVLSQISDFQRREKELKSRIYSALLYPVILMIMTLGVLVYLLVFFIPRFQKIFIGFGASLPWITRAIVGMSAFLTKYGPFIAVLLAVAGLLIHKALQTEQGRRFWQKWLLQVPVIGPLSARLAMTRFCRMLGTLVASGVPLIAALRVARESIGNQTLTDAVIRSIERVQKGDSLAASLSECPSLFPGSVLEMISVAEETGRLDQELVRLAEVTEKDLDQQLRMAVSLAEPLMLFVMAAFIGTIFVGMVIPIFSIQDYIK